MLYVSGTYALNLNSPDGTPGDWHSVCIDWAEIELRDSTNSVFADWGIASAKVPMRGVLPAASHVRACLDLIEGGYYSAAQGMREHFIADEDYDEVIFDKVLLLKDAPTWKEIDAFMGREYLCKWLDYKQLKGL